MGNIPGQNADTAQQNQTGRILADSTQVDLSLPGMHASLKGQLRPGEHLRGVEIAVAAFNTAPCLDDEKFFNNFVRKLDRHLVIMAVYDGCRSLEVHPGQLPRRYAAPASV